MTPIATILAATDFSPDGNNAVRRAALLARQLDARLTLLHVVDQAGFEPLRGWFSRLLEASPFATVASPSASQHDRSVA